MGLLIALACLALVLACLALVLEYIHCTPSFTNRRRHYHRSGLVECHLPASVLAFVHIDRFQLSPVLSLLNTAADGGRPADLDSHPLGLDIEHLRAAVAPRRRPENLPPPVQDRLPALERRHP